MQEPMKKKPQTTLQSAATLCDLCRTATVKKPSENNSISHQVATCKRFARGEGGLLGEIVSSPILGIPASP